MFFKIKKRIPDRPWICGTPMRSAIADRDKRAVKEALDFEYTTLIEMHKWDLKYGDLTDIEKAEIEIKVGAIRELQKENGFGPWYHEYNLDKIKFKD